MTEPFRAEEVQAELVRAGKALEAARSLLEDAFFEDALSRGYYAILHAARAALLAEGVSVSSSSGSTTFIRTPSDQARETSSPVGEDSWRRTGRSIVGR